MNIRGDFPDTAVPLKIAETPILDQWYEEGEARINDGWANFVGPDGDYRVGIELVDLYVPSQQRVTDAWEITLWALDENPPELVIRETIGDDQLAMTALNQLAWDASNYEYQAKHDLPTPRPAQVAQEGVGREDR